MQYDGAAMRKAKTSEALWKRVAPRLQRLEAEELCEIAYELFKLAPENRAFLAAWVGDGDAERELSQLYISKICEQFERGGVDGVQPDVAACRQVIKEYQRVTTSPVRASGFDVCGVIGLGLVFIEECAAYVENSEWRHQRAFAAMCGVARDLAELFGRKEAKHWAKPFAPRVGRLNETAKKLGGGLEDDVEELLRVVEAKAGLSE
jgi:hypothetical protein